MWTVKTSEQCKTDNNHSVHAITVCMHILQDDTVLHAYVSNVADKVHLPEWHVFCSIMK